MKKMSRKIALLLVVVTVFSLTLIQPVSAAGAIAESSTKVNGKSVNAVTINIADSNVEFFPVIANNKILSAGNIADIAASNKSKDTANIAAINGDFFAAYDGTNLPYGISKQNGEIFHAGGQHAAIAFMADGTNTAAEVAFAGTITFTPANGGRVNSLAYWGINHIFEYDDQVVLYTSYWGTETGTVSGKSAVVRNGKVVDIVSGNAPIYKDGYTVYFGSTSPFDRYSIGDSVEYDTTLTDGINGAVLKWDNAKTIISGGPLIVRDGKVVTNYVEQGFIEAKIISGSAQRSFLFVTANNKIIIGTVSATMKELTDIALSLGAVNALNLDGGASSALYLNGKTITAQGRPLTNVLIFREKTATASTPSVPITPPVSNEPSSWAAKDVSAAIAAGIVPQGLQSKYNQTATRAEFCALAVALYENATGEEITERAEFSDTTDINVQKMAGLGVVTGSDGKFNPNGALNREQAATLAVNLTEALGKPLTEAAATFADNDSISTWAKVPVGKIQAAGIMGGSNNKFDPKGSYTREQSIITMLKVFDAVK